ncbi:MAG: hypothetical protein L3J20_11555 [Flavobacteriaceae bacterium]|nr:hypothetical protein [Flavobacteriaceae bacterium]
MKMLTDLRKKIDENTKIIDFAISKYFANRLGVKDTKTIDALGINGNLTFTQKVNIFCDILPLTKIDEAKLKVYTKVNNEIVLNNDILTYDQYFSNLNCYHPFLFNTYLEENDVLSIKEKLTFAIHQLIDDVVRLTDEYIKKPQVYYNKNVGITLPE